MASSCLSPDDVEGYINTLQNGECISERALKRLCAAVSELMMEESNVQPVLSPVTIVGDLHDRGHNSVETLSLLLCLKWKFPGKITLLRGNHE
eukprot:5283406-Ditylum_brightwellii.AAC.1